MADANAPLITFAVICKNEAGNIGRCLTSLVREAADLDAEILVVDSFSTDDTVSIAQGFPVTIVQLGRDWPHSPAAGRYTAVRHAQGEYLMVVDADMELLPGFVAAALRRMAHDPELVAVRGRLHNYNIIDGRNHYVNSDLGGRHVDFRVCSSEGETEISVATGAALFRLEALRSAGNFHPFLKAEEEFEVAQRLISRGGRLLYLPMDAVNHYGYLPDPLAEIRRRLSRGLIGGIGQMVRLSFQEGFGMQNLLRFRLQLFLALCFALGVPALRLLPLTPALFMAWLAICALLLGVYWARKGSFRRALAACLHNVLIGFDIARGLFTPVPHKTSYPEEVVIMYGIKDTGN